MTRSESGLALPAVALMALAFAALAGCGGEGGGGGNGGGPVVGRWAAQQSGTNVKLLSVWFLDRNRGFAAGEDGTLLKTATGGADWEPVDVNTNSPLTRVSFAGSRGWVTVRSGSVTYILCTEDEGETWREVSVPPENQMSHWFINGRRGWISATGQWTGGIWRTDDGGHTWQHKGTGLANWIYSFAFLNWNVGYAINDWSRVWRTDDGGDSWQEVSGFGAGIESSENPQAFAILGPGEVLLAHGTYDPRIDRTTDGGKTWARCPGTTGALAVFALDGGDVWAVGDAGVICHSSNRGRSWKEYETPTSADLMAVHFADAEHGWAVGEGGVVLHYSG